MNVLNVRSIVTGAVLEFHDHYGQVVRAITDIPVDATRAEFQGAHQPRSWSDFQSKELNLRS
jgi:hypothetical protein